MRLLLCLLCAGLLVHSVLAFKCQSVVNTYNMLVDVGNFTGAAALTFTDNVQYIIPGPSDACPYCGVYQGKDAVIGLFVNGFLGHFTIVNPLVNLREITTDTGGPGGVPELMDFNDEGFRILPQFGSRYFRVHVIHDFLFDPESCLISQMHLYHDPYVAAMAFAGHSAVAVPIMPGLSQIPPATSFVVSNATNLDNWQFIPGEDGVAPAAAWATVVAYYNAVSNGSILSSDVVQSLFIALDYTLPQQMAAILVPGDSTVLPFGSLWMDQPEVVTYHQMRANTVKENTPLQDPNSHNVTMGGSVAMLWRMSGVALSTNLEYEVDAVDYFQCVMQGGSVKIARLSRFFDTWNVTLAITNNNPYPQFNTPGRSRSK